MASTFTSRLRYELMANGENDTTWGTKANVVFQLAEDSIAGVATLAVTGGTDILTANNSATDEARMAILKVTGTLVSNEILQIPSTSKKYLIWNATSGSFSVTIKTSGGTGLVITQGSKVNILCDGTDCFALSYDIQAAGSDIASASTIDLTTEAAKVFHVTGTTTVTTVTMNSGQVAVVIVDAALPLTYHATTNNINTGGNDTTLVAGDRIIYHKDNAGTVHGEIIKNSGESVITSGTALDIDASVASSALTISLQASQISFRASTLSDGTPTAITISSAINLVVPSGATLGTFNASVGRLLVLAINNSGTVELAVANADHVGTTFDEEGVITTVALDADADSADAIYSTTQRTGVPYRIIGIVESTQTTAGTWNSGPNLVQSTINLKMQVSKVFRSASTAFNSSTTFNVTSIPAWVKRITIFQVRVSWSGVNEQIVQIGTSSGLETTGYSGNGIRAGSTGDGEVQTTGFGVESSTQNSSLRNGKIVLDLMEASTNTWVSTSILGGESTVSYFGGGSKPLSLPLDRFTIKTDDGADTWDAGSMSYMFEGWL